MRGPACILPAVAYAERIRQVEVRGQDATRFRKLLRWAKIEIEPFTDRQADRYCRGLDDAAWSRHNRDAMIAGHLERGDVLLTTNPRDFRKLGVPEDQVQAV